MGIWNKNNRACTTLWSTLYTMQQLKSKFTDSGALAMVDLTFYNPLSSGDLIKQEATILADQLDNVLRHARGAKYENGFDRSKAKTTLITVLVDSEKQVSDLAETIDEAYLFWGE